MHRAASWLGRSAASRCTAGSRVARVAASASKAQFRAADLLCRQKAAGCVPLCSRLLSTDASASGFNQLLTVSREGLFMGSFAFDAGV